MSPEERAKLIDETVEGYESESDSEIEEALERAQVLAKTFEALLSERRQKQMAEESDLEMAKKFIVGEMERARRVLRKMNKPEPEILTPDDINTIVIPSLSGLDLSDADQSTGPRYRKYSKLDY
ncbi:MAG TPA: hypothetical protein VFJ63_04065 [Candidatus Bathyarchaeia archaeon]|nr:hypothetical protein [Candidatus Bathyarchaeia archaeon]